MDRTQQPTLICLLDVSANKGQSDALAPRKPALTYRDGDQGDPTAGRPPLLKWLEFPQLQVKLDAPVCVFVIQIPTLKLFETRRETNETLSLWIRKRQKTPTIT